MLCGPDTRIPRRFPDPLPNILVEVRPTDPHAILRPIDPADPMAGLEAAVSRSSRPAPGPRNFSSAVLGRVALTVTLARKATDLRKGWEQV